MTVTIERTGPIAVLGIDPGSTTGVAVGYFELRGSLRETLATRSRVRGFEVEGPWLDQARELADLMTRFRYRAQVEQQLPAVRVRVAIENYTVRLPAAGTNLDSVWVAAGAVACAGDGEDVWWIEPADSKRRATDERLRSWGLWWEGSAHIRDAWRAVAVALDRSIG